MTPQTGPRRVPVGPTGSIPEGGRKLVVADGLRIGVFNVGGSLYAFHDRCPHRGGPLCAGHVTGTTAPAQDTRRLTYDRAGRILRCPWHGWEFELETGSCLADPKIRARTYPVEIVDGDAYVVLGHPSTRR